MQTGGGGADLQDRSITHLFAAFGQYNTGLFLLLALLLAQPAFTSGAAADSARWW